MASAPFSCLTVLHLQMGGADCNYVVIPIVHKIM